MAVTTRGTNGDPVRLDPFQQIVEVGWPSGGGLVAIVATMQHGFSEPPGTLISTPLLQFSTGNVWNIFGADPLYVHALGSSDSPEVVNPVSPEMLRNLLMWSRPRFFHDDVSTSEGGATTIVLTAIYGVFSLHDGIIGGFGVTSSPTDIAADFAAAKLGWEGVGINTDGWIPYLETVLTFESVPGVTITSHDRAYAAVGFVNIAKAKKSSPLLGMTLRTPPATAKEHLAVSIGAQTYRTLRDFPLNPDNTPLWTTPADGESGRTVTSPPEAPLPSKLITLQVNLNTLAVTSSVS